ncbi:MAG: hypothetical protein HY901_09060, partial [Deltaproteobacteria bacterium]|nr:hypothetical protein [Deltaproteobacteria bacterium]
AKSYADVAVIASHDSLPAKGSSALYLYGSAYVELIPAALGGPIRIAVEADAASEWACSLLVGRQGQATERIVLPFQGAKASLETGALAGASWAMLVVSQHADGAYDPDAMDYTVTRSFTYELTAAESADAGGDSSDAALESAADGSASESGAGDGAAGAAAGGAATQPESDSGCACRMGTTRGVGRPETVLLVALAAVARRLRRRARDVLFPPMS